MDMSGERRIPAPRQKVWEALNDPAVRQAISYGINRSQLNVQGETGYEPPVNSTSGLLLPNHQSYLDSSLANNLPATGDAAKVVPACMACHGPVGRGAPAAGFPALRGQHSVYTIKQLTDYASDSRYLKDDKGARRAGPNVPMMVSIANRLTAEDRRRARTGRGHRVLRARTRGP